MLLSVPSVCGLEGPQKLFSGDMLVDVVFAAGFLSDRCSFHDRGVKSPRGRRWHHLGARRGEHAAATHKDWAQSVVLHKLWATMFVFLSAGDLWRPEAHNLPARSFCGTTDWAEYLWVSRKARDKDIDLDVTSGHAALRAGLPAPEPVL